MNYHFVTEGPSADAFQAGLGKVIELAIGLGAGQIGLAIPQFSTLQGIVGNVLGEPANQLAGGDHTAPLNVNDEHDFQLCVFTQLHQPQAFNGPILVAFASIQQAQALDALDGCTDIIFVPHSAAEAADFATEFNSEELPVPNQ